MSEIASASINTFGSKSPKANVPPDDPILEIRSSEFQLILKEAVDIFNQAVEMVKDAGVLRGKDLARMTTRASDSLKATRSPIEKLMLLFAYLKQLLAKIREALKARPPTEQGVIRQAITKIQLRAVAIIDHVKTLAEGKEKIALDSSQARQYLSGREGKPPSRRDAIRALRRAEKICPALTCGHKPGDGRMTMRVIAKTENLKESQIVEESRDRDRRQRSRMEEIRIAFFKEPV